MSMIPAAFSLQYQAIRDGIVRRSIATLLNGPMSNRQLSQLLEIKPRALAQILRVHHRIERFRREVGSGRGELWYQLIGGKNDQPLPEIPKELGHAAANRIEERLIRIEHLLIQMSTVKSPAIASVQG